MNHSTRSSSSHTSTCLWIAGSVVCLTEGEKDLPTRCVLSGSCPQLLDPPLRTTHHPVDVKSVGVSRYLGRYPARQSNNGRRQRLTQAENSLQARKGDLYLLPYSGSLATGFAGHQHDPQLGQFLLQVLAAVGEIRQEPPRYLLA